MDRTSPLSTLDTRTQGWINGFIGVVIFSGSLPATRLAVMEFDPVFLTLIRAAIAGLLGLALLWLFKEKRPARPQWMPLAIVALGVVIGFPLLTALALQYVTSAHSIVFIGLLPLATAVFGVLRGGERPRPVFWLFSILGSLLVMGYAFAQGLSAAPAGDVLMLLAVLVCGLGYAEGAKLSRSLGGWQVICWALVLSTPVLIGPVWYLAAQHQGAISMRTWWAFGYVSLFSQFLGFFAWYAGLAMGGIARVSQIQLLQIFFTIAFSALFFGEHIEPITWVFACGVIVTVMLGRKTAVQAAPIAKPAASA
jgi:drug/metabolite transporter (DMT)-like permease